MALEDYVDRSILNDEILWPRNAILRVIGWQNLNKKIVR